MRVHALEVAVHRIVCGTVSRFVTERPDHDAGVVVVSAHHAHAAFKECVCPVGVVGQPAHRRHAVGFYIGLIYHVHAQSVTQVIKPGLMGIVGAANRIEVVLLHQPNIALNRFQWLGVAMLRMVLVLVYAADEHWFAVKPQHAVDDLDLSKTNVGRLGFHFSDAIAVEQCQGESIEVGFFCTPEFDGTCV